MRQSSRGKLITMFAIVMFVCSGLLVYWISRTRLLLNGSKPEINEALNHDFWRGRRFLIALRGMLGASTQLAG